MATLSRAKLIKDLQYADRTCNLSVVLIEIFERTDHRATVLQDSLKASDAMPKGGMAYWRLSLLRGPAVAARL